MGTYTTNKELYKPSVGETGWGEIVNNNFSTIDNFLKPITVSGSTYTFTGNQNGGTITATKITNSGTLTSTGKITGNGGIAGTTGTFSGAVTGKTFNGIVLKSSGTITVTAGSTNMGLLPILNQNAVNVGTLTLLPPCGTVRYTGSIKFYNSTTASANTRTMAYYDGSSNGYKRLEITDGSTAVLSFTNIPFLVCKGGNGNDTMGIGYCSFTLS